MNKKVMLVGDYKQNKSAYAPTKVGSFTSPAGLKINVFPHKGESAASANARVRSKHFSKK